MIIFALIEAIKKFKKIFYASFIIRIVQCFLNREFDRIRLGTIIGDGVRWSPLVIRKLTLATELNNLRLL